MIFGNGSELMVSVKGTISRDIEYTPPHIVFAQNGEDDIVPITLTKIKRKTLKIKEINYPTGIDVSCVVGDVLQASDTITVIKTKNVRIDVPFPHLLIVGENGEKIKIDMYVQTKSLYAVSPKTIYIRLSEFRPVIEKELSIVRKAILADIQVETTHPGLKIIDKQDGYPSNNNTLVSKYLLVIDREKFTQSRKEKLRIRSQEGIEEFPIIVMMP